MASSNASAGVVGEDTGVETSIKKHSLLLQDSSSESETEGTTKEEGAANEFFGSLKKIHKKGCWVQNELFEGLS